MTFPRWVVNVKKQLRNATRMHTQRMSTKPALEPICTTNWLLSATIDGPKGDTVAWYPSQKAMDQQASESVTCFWVIDWDPDGCTGGKLSVRC